MKIAATFLVYIFFATVAAPTFFASGQTNYLTWRAEQNRVDADIQTWDLRTVLERVSNATRWQVYYEPQVKNKSVSAKFSNLASDQALKLLLGNLNYVLAPNSNGVFQLFVYSTSRSQATELIEKPFSTNVSGSNRHLIPNQLVVVLRPGCGSDASTIAKKYNAKIVGNAKSLNAYVFEFEDDAGAKEARTAVENETCVASVESNYRFERPKPSQRLAQSSSNPFTLQPTGDKDSAIIVGLIDTAVQSLGAEMDGFVLPAIHVAGESKNNGDQPTHGTSMAEAVLLGLDGTMPDGKQTTVKILPVNVYGANGSATTFNVAAGIAEAINNGADIISLSLGSDGDSPLLRSLIEDASGKNIPIFAAAGNEPVTTPVYPAAYPEVIAVTAAGDREGNIADYANRGDFVDVIFPGATVIKYKNRPYYVAGTSVATALGAGMVAGVADVSGKPPKQIEAVVRQQMSVKKSP